MSFHQMTYYQIRCDNCGRLWGSEGSRWATKEIVERWFLEGVENGRGTWSRSGGKHLCGTDDCDARRERNPSRTPANPETRLADIREGEWQR